METKDEILNNLPYYTGTTNWFRLFGDVLYTDGVKYLATAAEAYWLIDAVGSHLLGHGTDDPFAVASLVVIGSSAVLTLDDGNGNVWAKQDIPHTDFPLDDVKLYAVWDGSVWVVMLTSEY